MLKTTYAIIMLAWFAVGMPLWADTVVLKNEGEFVGVVEKETEKEIILRMAYGTMAFQKSEVRSLQRASGAENERIGSSWGGEQERIARERSEREAAAASRREMEEPKKGDERPEMRRDVAAPSLPAQGLQTRSKLAAPLLKSGAWARQSTQHFTIFSQDSAIGKAVGTKAEYYLEKIRYDLNMSREVNWPDPCEVFIVRDEPMWDDLLSSRMRGETAAGFSVVGERLIFIKGQSDPRAVGTFAHELAHILITELGQGRSVPLWLQEGLAIYESGELLSQARLLRETVMLGKQMTFAQLHDTYRGRYPPSQELRIIFYLEASSVVDFLINRFGREKFGEFALELMKESDLTRVVRKVFSGQFYSANELYNAWLESVKG